jgi:hypothetical protein
MDIRGDGSAFTLPRRKWRELLFIGAMVPDGDFFVRDPGRPLPAFNIPNLFPEGVRFRVQEGEKRVFVQRVD